MDRISLKVNVSFSSGQLWQSFWKMSSYLVIQKCNTFFKAIETLPIDFRCEWNWRTSFICFLQYFFNIFVWCSNICSICYCYCCCCSSSFTTISKFFILRVQSLVDVSSTFPTASELLFFKREVLILVVTMIKFI